MRAAGLLLLIFLSPLAQGLVQKLKARLQGRRGAPLLQPYFLLLKLLRRQAIYPEASSQVMRWAPMVAMGGVLVALYQVPVLVSSGQDGDLLLLFFSLALVRFVMATAALDTGTPFGGLGASREITLGTFVEPALLAVFLPWVLRAGSTGLTAMVQASMAVAPLDLVRVAALSGTFILLIAETGRLPVDNPDTHLELTMIHEAMLLEYSGPPLFWILLGSWVKQLLLVALAADLIFPWGLLGPSPWALFLQPAKWALFLVALAVTESRVGKVRFLRLPATVATAMGLALVALVVQLGGAG